MTVNALDLQEDLQRYLLLISSLVLTCLRCEGEYKSLRTKYDELRGSMETLREQCKRDERDLSQPKYRTVDDEFQKLMITLKVSLIQQLCYDCLAISR